MKNIAIYFIISILVVVGNATGDLTLPSSGLVLNNDIKLYYEINSGTLSLMLEVQNQGWVGIGFSGSMINCDMVAFTSSGGTISAYDAYSTGEVTPSVSEPQDWTITGQDLQANSFKVKATRLLNTGDSMDTILSLGQTYSFCAAWDTSPSFSMHTGALSYKVNLSNGLGLQSSSSFSVGASESELDAHKIILFYGWGICMDIAIFVIRYLKTWKHYVLAHTLIFLLLDVSTIVVVAIILGENKSKLSNLDGLSDDVKNHYILGVIILAIVIIQHIMGVVLKINSQGTSKHVHLIKKFHQVFGTILYIISKANVIIGADLEGEIVGGIIITVISLSALIIAEIVTRIFRHQQRHDIFDYSYTEVEMSFNKETKEEEIQLMKLLNEDRRDIDQIVAALPNLTWVIYNKAVYNITDFVHPGGQYIINQIKGKEIGRYLIGSLGLEGFDTPAYTHSPNAIKYLRRYFIGYLDYTDSNTLVMELSSTSEKRDPKISLHIFNPFNIEKVVPLSSSISQFEFKSSSIKIQNVLKGIHWIGRHFQLKIENQSKSRLYTQVLCQTSENSAFRNQIIDFAEKTLSGQQPAAPNVTNFTTFSQTLPLIIKKYNFKGALSKQLHEENVNNQYSIQGPLGTGLGFSEATINKRIYIFAVGTGLFPFLDLLDFLLKKTLVELLPQHKQKLDPFSIDYEKYFKGCQFTIFTGFHQIEDFIGREWILKLVQFSKKANNNLIKLNIKIKEGTFPEEVGRITHKSYGTYIQENIDDSQFDKVFICGPPQMYNQVIDSLKKKGVSPFKIVNV